MLSEIKESINNGDEYDESSNEREELRLYYVYLYGKSSRPLYNSVLIHVVAKTRDDAYTYFTKKLIALREEDYENESCKPCESKITSKYN